MRRRPQPGRLLPGGAARRRRHRHIEDEADFAGAMVAAAEPDLDLDLEDFLYPTWTWDSAEPAVSDR